jgi:hypothetical protein
MLPTPSVHSTGHGRVHGQVQATIASHAFSSFNGAWQSSGSGASHHCLPRLHCCVAIKREKMGHPERRHGAHRTSVQAPPHTRVRCYGGCWLLEREEHRACCPSPGGALLSRNSYTPTVLMYRTVRLPGSMGKDTRSARMMSARTASAAPACNAPGTSPSTTTPAPSPCTIPSVLQVGLVPTSFGVAAQSTRSCAESTPALLPRSQPMLPLLGMLPPLPLAALPPLPLFSVISGRRWCNSARRM